MAIGLTSEEMVNLFLNNSKARMAGIVGEISAAKHGESPENEKILADLQAQYPELPLPIIILVHTSALAIIDVIEANNISIKFSLST
jgi:hypothetical protein